MLYKGELTLASPRNITINVLDANTFFSLDYESDSVHNLKNKTNGFFTDQKGDKQKKRNSNTSHHNSYLLKDVVKSAQYHRKINPVTTAFRGTNLYGRIKKVDDMIEQRKRIINISLQQDAIKRSLEEPKEKMLPQIKSIGQKKYELPSEELKYQNYLFDTLPLTSRSGEKKNQKNYNSFCDNYKNRRKLTDRMAHKKVSKKNGSPLRRDVSPAEYVQQRMNDKRHWSPYRGKLLTNRNLQFLRQSVQGNKINYVSPEPADKGDRCVKKH